MRRDTTTARGVPRSIAPGEQETRRFYRRTLKLLDRSGLPYLIGGAFALGEYTGVMRRTKDLDLFVRPEDCRPVLDVLAAAGLDTEMTDPVWLAKAHSPDGAFVDLIFRSGNGICEVDDEWFTYARSGFLFGLPARFCPAEETIWVKSYIMERNRYDGADVAHYLLACGDRLDWDRLLRRFGPHWRVLLAHLVLFGFIYPGRQSRIAASVVQQLTLRLEQEVASPPGEGDLCQGTLLSRAHYLHDVELAHYRDARFLPGGRLTEDEIVVWQAQTEAERPDLLRSEGIILQQPGRRLRAGGGARRGGARRA